MFGNIYAERQALEATYEDTATVTRRQNKADRDNIARPQAVPVYTEIICAISSKGDSSRQTEAQHTVAYDRLLFVQPDKDIKPGDFVTVYRFARFSVDRQAEEKFEVVGVPMVYATHREIPLKAVTLA